MPLPETGLKPTSTTLPVPGALGFPSVMTLPVNCMNGFASPGLLCVRVAGANRGPATRRNAPETLKVSPEDVIRGPLTVADDPVRPLLPDMSKNLRDGIPPGPFASAPPTLKIEFEVVKSDAVDVLASEPPFRIATRSCVAVTVTSDSCTNDDVAVLVTAPRVVISNRLPVSIVLGSTTRSGRWRLIADPDPSTSTTLPAEMLLSVISTSGVADGAAAMSSRTLLKPTKSTALGVVITVFVASSRVPWICTLPPKRPTVGPLVVTSLLLRITSGVVAVLADVVSSPFSKSTSVNKLLTVLSETSSKVPLTVVGLPVR